MCVWRKLEGGLKQLLFVVLYQHCTIDHFNPQNSRSGHSGSESMRWGRRASSVHTGWWGLRGEFIVIRFVIMTAYKLRDVGVDEQILLLCVKYHFTPSDLLLCIGNLSLTHLVQGIVDIWKVLSFSHLFLTINPE